MAKVVAGMTISLDGFVNDRDGRASALYPDLAEMGQQQRMKEAIRSTGAVLMGRKTFEMAKDPDAFAGNYEFQVPLFILTRHPPARHPKEGFGLTFTFVGDGLESALRQAKAAAGSRDVMVVGGPRLIQSMLEIDAIDELEIDVMPVLLKQGRRLFENLGPEQVSLARLRVDELPAGRTGLRFAMKG